MFRIAKVFEFEASHQLHGLPEEHQCGRLHGHSYKIELTFVGSVLTDEGWLFDFGQMKTFKQFVDERLDHRHLNDEMAQPTSENLARFLYDTASDMLYSNAFGLVADEVYLEKVRVSETAKTYAEYFGV
jgi:6-pyruvoyltetrahydropterin/6-carboxytetrahydropterin synthase